MDCAAFTRAKSGARRITLSKTRVHVPPPTARAASSGGNEDTMTNQQKTQALKMEKEEMKLKTESSALPAVQPVTTETLAQLDADVAALAAEARDLTDDVRVGDDLRFKKGKWAKTIGDEAIKIGATTPFAVDMRSYKRGWREWRDRKPVRNFIGRPIDGFVSPVRDRLPDRDESRWPTDARGVPQDPWQETFSIVMRDLSDGRLCTWTTTSWYGSKALGALLNKYTREAKQHPDQMPVVTLSSETKQTMNFGEVEAPVLKIFDWQPFGEGAAPSGMKLPPPALPSVQQVLPPIGEELSDDVSF
jgi:hypothetical protein